ncbi:hypothetical protein N2382_05305 [SAR92 clade bacterium H921]|nr:hypothetical protein [SAR92 clade bacterium H921]
MIRELTLSEVDLVAGANISVAKVINTGSAAIASIACPIAHKTRHPYAAIACGAHF